MHISSGCYPVPTDYQSHKCRTGGRSIAKGCLTRCPGVRVASVTAQTRHGLTTQVPDGRHSPSDPGTNERQGIQGYVEFLVGVDVQAFDSCTQYRCALDIYTHQGYVTCRYRGAAQRSAQHHTRDRTSPLYQKQKSMEVRSYHSFIRRYGTVHQVVGLQSIWPMKNAVVFSRALISGNLSYQWKASEVLIPLSTTPFSPLWNAPPPARRFQYCNCP